MTLSLPSHDGCKRSYNYLSWIITKQEQVTNLDMKDIYEDEKDMNGRERKETVLGNEDPVRQGYSLGDREERQ